MMLAAWVAILVGFFVYDFMASRVPKFETDADHQIRGRLHSEHELMLKPLLDASTSPVTWIEFWSRLGLVHEQSLSDEIDYPSPSDAYSTNSGSAIAVVKLVRGQTHDHFARKARELAVMLAAPRGVRIVEIDSVNVGIEVLNPVDPLGSPVIVESPSPMIDFRLTIGITDRGDAVLDLRERSGWLVAGSPGSGKSGSLQAITASLCASAAVEVAVIDGKGGSEWEWLRNRAFKYCSESSSLEDIRSAVEDVHSLMVERLQTVRATIGRPNIWSDGVGPTDSFPLIVTLIDECQFLFDQKMSIGAAEKKTREAITALVTDLLRRGRSVGFLTVLATQKPTTDAIPSAIRENCGIRMSFAVSTDDAGVAALGDSVRSSSTTPWQLRLPTDRGICVTDLAENGFERVRCFFMSEEHARDCVRLVKAADPQHLLASQ